MTIRNSINWWRRRKSLPKNPKGNQQFSTNFCWKIWARILVVTQMNKINSQVLWMVRHKTKRCVDFYVFALWQQEKGVICLPDIFSTLYIDSCTDVKYYCTQHVQIDWTTVYTTALYNCTLPGVSLACVLSTNHRGASIYLLFSDWCNRRQQKEL